MDGGEEPSHSPHEDREEPIREERKEDLSPEPTEQSRRDQQEGKYVRTPEEEAATVFIGNIPYHITRERFIQIFSPIAQVADVTLPKQNDGRSKGVAFVRFESPEQAQKIVEEFDHREIDGRVIYVKLASDPQTPFDERRHKRHGRDRRRYHDREYDRDSYNMRERRRDREYDRDYFDDYGPRRYGYDDYGPPRRAQAFNRGFPFPFPPMMAPFPPRIPFPDRNYPMPPFPPRGGRGHRDIIPHSGYGMGSSRRPPRPDDYYDMPPDLQGSPPHQSPR